MKAIVCFNNGVNRYIHKQQRQAESLTAIGFDGVYKCFSDFGEINSQAHHTAPYAFKPKAIDTMRKQGYDLVLWMDSPVYATKPLNKVFENIKEVVNK